MTLALPDLWQYPVTLRRGRSLTTTHSAAHVRRDCADAESLGLLHSADVLSLNALGRALIPMLGGIHIFQGKVYFDPACAGCLDTGRGLRALIYVRCHLVRSDRKVTQH